MTTTDILERTDTTDLSELDFETICEVRLALFLNGHIISEKPCEEPAAWAGNYPCCGKLCILCDIHLKHKETTFLCLPCERKFHVPDLVGVRPL